MSIPAEAQAHTEEGGIAFATFAVIEGSKALAANDPASFLSLTLPDCSGCQAIPTAIQAQIAADRWAESPRAVVEAAQLAAPESPAGLQVNVMGIEKGGPLVNAKGEVVGQVAENQLRMRLAITWMNGQWRVAQVAAVTV